MRFDATGRQVVAGKSDEDLDTIIDNIDGVGDAAAAAIAAAEMVAAGLTLFHFYDYTLHRRINGVRDEHVKKTDFLEQLQCYDRSIRELRQEMRTDTKAIQSRLDTRLARGQRPGE